MAAVNPEFGKELKNFGAYDFNACYNCGNCTAVCSLSTEEDSFPREMVRLSVLGFEEDLKSSLKPWLCYYCGECSSHCPQTANPGELMMSLRRWLSSKYDWTRLSGLLYRSLPLTIIALLLTATGVIGFAAYEHYYLPAIMHSGHRFELWAILIVFALILFPNIIRMWWYTILKPKIKVPALSYVTAFWELIIHMFTQKRALRCDDNRFRWFEHLVLVVGYLALLFTTVVLDWFSTENIFVIILGYVESILVFLVTADFVINRIRKKKEASKFSQPSDWFFVIWLFLMGSTAFVVRLMIDTNSIANNTWMYLFHLTILVQWAVLIVPFGKWTHFLYRSFAMYFAKMISSSVKLGE